MDDIEFELEPIDLNDPRFRPNALAEFIKECNCAELDPDTFVDFNGRRYRAPFRCLCCGKQVSLAQFCFGRLCGSCDCGACQPGSRSFNRRAHHERLSRDFYLTISEPAPIEVDATESIN
jgi:hypothetical protein